MIENELKYFQAKSLKLVLPLVFPPDLIQRFVVSTEGVPRMIEDKSPVEVVPSDFMKLPGRVPPPKSWVDAEGKTPEHVILARASIQLHARQGIRSG